MASGSAFLSLPPLPPRPRPPLPPFPPFFLALAAANLALIGVFFLPPFPRPAALALHRHTHSCQWSAARDGWCSANSLHCTAGAATTPSASGSGTAPAAATTPGGTAAAAAAAAWGLAPLGCEGVGPAMSTSSDEGKGSTVDEATASRRRCRRGRCHGRRRTWPSYGSARRCWRDAHEQRQPVEHGAQLGEQRCRRSARHHSRRRTCLYPCLIPTRPGLCPRPRPRPPPEPFFCDPRDRVSTVVGQSLQTMVMDIILFLGFLPLASQSGH